MELQISYCVCNGIFNHTSLGEFNQGKLLLHLTIPFEKKPKTNLPSDNLKYYRQRKQMTTRQLAEKLDIVPATVVMYESGKHPIPYDVAIKLADVLKIKAALFYDDFSRFLAVPYTEALKSVRMALGLSQKDEIILCLNYDGLYGINNINRFLQNSNPSPAIQWGIGLYKVGDPVLFNESDRFSPLIHNNSKGRIVGITTEELKIWFEIELDCAINELDAWGYDFELMDVSESGNSIIKFSVDKYRSTDEDDDYSDTVVPFRVAYAVSIHKAQGLEYRSVKIVITNETEERITHNIFYTAITRAKENLKIYWSPETEKSVLGRLEVRDSRRDANLLKQLYSL